MIQEILSNPAFMSKVAELQERPLTIEQQGEQLRDCLLTFKAAGMSPFEAVGFMQGIMELFPTEHFQKHAEEAPYQPQAGTWDYIKANGPAEGRQHWWNPFSWGGGWTPEQIKGSKERVVEDYIHGASTHAPEVEKAILESGKNHPIANTVSQIMPDDASRAKFMANMHNGHYGDAMGQAWNGLVSNPTVQKWAPYVLPGIATLGAAKMMGAGWGGAALAGLGAGTLMGSANEAGGYGNVWKNLVGGRLPWKNAPGSPQPGVGNLRAQEGADPGLNSRAGQQVGAGAPPSAAVTHAGEIGNNAAAVTAAQHNAPATPRPITPPAKEPAI